KGIFACAVYGPTNYILTNLGVHILPLAFPCTLAISDDDWTRLPAFPDQDGNLVNELSSKRQASSGERSEPQATSVKRHATICTI
ncbi:MAG: hypothetical protein ACO23H_20985, partial [Alphaproteobacteria bacterium]